MKKLTCLFLIICVSVVVASAKGSGRRFVASLDNKQVVQAQKDQRRSLRNFGSGRRYSAATRGHGGFHPFGRRRGGSGSNPDNGLGL
jgi:hypothetical protein